MVTIYYEDFFDLAAFFYRSFKTSKIVINGGDGKHFESDILGEAWPGADFWERELVARKVLKEDIYRTEPALNTKEENDGFLKIAREHNWKSAIITGCQPHQILRAFLEFLKSMIVYNYWMRVYAVVPREKNISFWWEKIYSYSAALPARDLPPFENRFKERLEMALLEFAKISEYQEKGHLATFENFFSYLKRRHTIY